MMALLHYDWTYNVRELESCAKRCVVLSEGKALSEEMLTADIAREMADYGREFAAADPSKEDSVAPRREDLVLLLERHQGNVAAVGRDLGKARMQIHRWLKRYAIDINAYRPE
jgi:DNA-binding NtrC family response regulator